MENEILQNFTLKSEKNWKSSRRETSFLNYTAYLLDYRLFPLFDRIFLTLSVSCHAYAQIFRNILYYIVYKNYIYHNRVMKIVVGNEYFA